MSDLIVVLNKLIPCVLLGGADGVWPFKYISQLELSLVLASYRFIIILSIIDETNIQMETASEETKELLKFRLNWLETKLNSLRETYGRK